MANRRRRNSGNRSRKSRSSGGSFSGTFILLGVMIGLLIATSGYLFFTKVSNDSNSRSKTTLAKVSDTSSSSSSSKKRKTSAAAERFEFYTLLPGMEVQLPDSSGSAKNRVQTKVPSQGPSSEQARSSGDLVHSSGQIARSSSMAGQTSSVSGQIQVPGQTSVSGQVQGSIEPGSDSSQRSHSSSSSSQSSHTQVSEKSERERGHAAYQEPVPRDQRVQYREPRKQPRDPKYQESKMLLKNKQSVRENNIGANKTQKSPLSTSEITSNKTTHQASDKSNTKVVKAGNSEARYIIQTGIFQDLNQADELKAKLTLQGFNTRIQKVQTQDGHAWFRVNLGPFSSEEKAIQQKKKLAAQKIQGILILQRPNV